jgi:hypothetical protein
MSPEPTQTDCGSRPEYDVVVGAGLAGIHAGFCHRGYYTPARSQETNGI